MFGYGVACCVVEIDCFGFVVVWFWVDLRCVYFRHCAEEGVVRGNGLTIGE